MGNLFFSYARGQEFGIKVLPTFLLKALEEDPFLLETLDTP